MNAGAANLPPGARLRRSSWRMRLFALGISTGLALLASELGLRGAGIGERTHYLPDQFCGYKPEPSAAYWHTTEGRVFVRNNRFGFRDREHAVAKPPGTFRIAVLGDSFAEAVHVEQEAAFWAVLERELAECRSLGDREIEVLNFGVCGHGTTQELQMLRHYVWPFEPDLVLLAIFPANDIHNNSLALEPDQRRPYYRYVDGRLALDVSKCDASYLDYLEKRKTSRWFWFKDAVIRNVRLVGIAYRAREKFRQWRASSRTAAHASPNAAELDDQVYVPPTDPQWKEAWSITGGVLDLAYREVTEHQAKFLVVVVNAAEQVHPDPAVIRQTASRLGVANLDYPDRRLAEIAEASGFPLLSLTEPMRTSAQRDSVFYHGFSNTKLGTGHWNEAGHKAAGELIAAYLCEHPELLE